MLMTLLESAMLSVKGIGITLFYCVFCVATVPGTDTFPSLKYSDGTEIQPQCYANAMQGVVMSDQIDEETKLLIDMNITHPEQCCTECIKLEKCMAYSYYNASHPSDSGKGDPVCLLHSKIVQTSAKPGWFYVLKDSIASDSDTKGTCSRCFPFRAWPMELLNFPSRNVYECGARATPILNRTSNFGTLCSDAPRVLTSCSHLLKCRIVIRGIAVVFYDMPSL